MRSRLLRKALYHQKVKHMYTLKYLQLLVLIFSPKPLFPNSRISAISALVSALVEEEPPRGSIANKIVIIIIIFIFSVLFFDIVIAQLIFLFSWMQKKTYTLKLILTFSALKDIFSNCLRSLSLRPVLFSASPYAFISYNDCTLGIQG